METTSVQPVTTGTIRSVTRAGGEIWDQDSAPRYDNSTGYLEFCTGPARAPRMAVEEVNSTRQVQDPMRAVLDRLLFGGTKRLRDYEEACVRALWLALPSNAQKTLEAQMTSIDLVQRAAHDKMVTVFFRRADPPLYANREDEFTIAVVSGKPPRSVRCSIVLHSGRLSSLEFSEPPRRLLAGCTPDDFSVEVNPVVQAESTVPHDPRVDVGVLGRLSSRIRLDDVQPPPEYSKPFGVSGAMPSDLLQLVSETGGFKVKSWRFYGATPRSIVRHDGTYYIFAENDETALCVREDEEEPLVYIYDQISDEVQGSTSGFVDALLDHVERSRDPKQTGRSDRR